MMLILGAVFLFASGCVTSKKFEDAAAKSVLERTPFDFDCDDATVARIGDVVYLTPTFTRMSFGATCEGKRGTYVVVCDSNLGSITCSPELNSARTTEK
jgi:hypothetical protein